MHAHLPPAHVFISYFWVLCLDRELIYHIKQAGRCPLQPHSDSLRANSLCGFRRFAKGLDVSGNAVELSPER